MTCYHPISGYICQDGMFRTYDMKGRYLRSQVISCGQCVGCRLERSRQWAVRSMHEASLYRFNSFITLTYDDKKLPDGYDVRQGLVYEHFQLFMKRLRKSYCGIELVDDAYPIKYYMCGEYGEDFGRPHFHACLFNFDFSDKVLWEKTSSGSLIYRSKILEELWPYGYSSVGDLNFQSAAYVARYIMKKQTGASVGEHYMVMDSGTGEIFNRSPEFNRMSLKPGIGARWFDKFSGDVYPNDYVVVKGRETRPPRYYDKLFSELDGIEFEAVQHQRFLNMKKHVDDNTPDRLFVKEQISFAKLDKLIRKLN